MEGLLILIGQFLGFPLIAGVAALAQGILSLLGLLLEFIFGISRKPKSDEPKKEISISPAVLMWVRRIALYSLSAFVGALLLVNFFFLEDVARYVTRKVEARTGVEIAFESIEGNLFTGQLAISRYSTYSSAAIWTQSSMAHS